MRSSLGDGSSGRSAVSRDGCSVEVYRRLPSTGEPELVHAWAGPRASVLDLGSGTGRIADKLVELGHPVLAVDDSAAMLAHVRRARTHLASIEELRLDECFDVVLLASQLVNTPDEDVRAALLASAAWHLRPGGWLLIQWHPPDWFDALRPGVSHEGTIGPLTSRLDVLGMDGDLLTAEVSYAADEDRWAQPFQARRLTLDQLDVQLHSAGLRRVPLAPGHPSWFAAALSRGP